MGLLCAIDRVQPMAEQSPRPITEQLPKLILASNSPRRRELLAAAGYRFEVHPPSPQAESDQPLPGETPEQLVARLALQKAADVAPRVTHGVIVACDTVVECDGQILGKPRDQSDARNMLQMLSGREHRVLSGLCLWPVGGAGPDVRVAVTRLRMDRLSREQIEEYVASGLWAGKAGAFGYQDRLGWIHVIDGSQSNVVGLPMELLAEMLARHGFSQPCP